MKIETIETELAPAAIGSYSQGIKVKDFIFVSGQIPINPQDGTIVNRNIREAAMQVCENVQAILKASGSSLELVVKTTCF